MGFPIICVLLKQEETITSRVFFSYKNSVFERDSRFTSIELVTLQFAVSSVYDGCLQRLAARHSTLTNADVYELAELP